MIALVLFLAVAGSFLSSGILLAQGASWGVTALGYVAGGWVGLVIGALLLGLWRLSRNSLPLLGLSLAEDNA